MKSTMSLAAVTATLAVLMAAPVLSIAQTSSQDTSSSSSSRPGSATIGASDGSESSSQSSSSADCPAKTATSQTPKPGRTTSSCTNPYVKQPGMSSSSSSSSALPH